MAKSFATLKAEILSELQDVAAATWNDSDNPTEIERALEDALREVSDYVSYFVTYRFEIESRTGTATSTLASNLVDSQGQFLSTDVGKVVYNTTDHTWATVSAYVDANTLTLTGDIMVSGDGYEIYNEDCRSSKEISIADVTDYIGNNHGVKDDTYGAPEYPKGTRRNVEVNGDVLTLLMDIDPDDSGDTDADVDVFVPFNTRQRVSQLTDFAGEIDLVAGYAAGSTTIHVDGLQSSGTFAEDTLFTIENCRGTYRVTADATIASNECDLTIFPALEDAVVDGADVTILGSTLSPRLERLVVQVAAGKTRMSKAGLFVGENFGGNVPTTHYTFGERQYERAIQELKTMRPWSIKQSYSRL